MSRSTMLVWCRALMCAAFEFVVLCHNMRGLLKKVEHLVEVVQEGVFVARLDWEAKMYLLRVSRSIRNCVYPSRLVGRRCRS